MELFPTLKFKSSVLFACFLLCLSACSSPETPPVLLPATLTEAPSQTPLPTPSFTPTKTRQPEPSPTITLPAPTPTLSLITPRPPDATLIVNALNAPDGRWVAESSFEYLDSGASYRVRLRVYLIDGSLAWNIVDYTQSGIGYTFPTLRTWSPDSRYFYYFNMPVGDGCGDFYPIEAQWTRLDVEDGTQSAFPLPEGRGHTLSPDGLTLIYASASQPYGIHFRSLVDASEQFFPWPPGPLEGQEVQAGGAVWSPDGTAFVLSVTYGNACSGEPLSFSVLRVDNPTNPKFTLLVSASQVLLRIRSWDPSDRILVMDWNNLSWWIDANTGQIVPAP